MNMGGAAARVYACLAETVVLLAGLGGPPIVRYRELAVKTPELDDLVRWQAVVELEEQGLLQRVGNGRLCLDLPAAKREEARLEGRLMISPGPRSRLSALA
jgi:hypothetical protein